MTVPNMADLARYKPRWLGVVELNIGDQWRAKWVDEQELPEDAPVIHAYGVVMKDDKGYVTRPEGSDEPWRTVEGALDLGDDPAKFIKQAARQQVGATIAKTELIGFLECKATSHNPDFPAGAMTVRPLYLAVAKKVGNIPEGSGFERRRLPMNEFMRALRHRYPEIEDYLAKATQRYAVLRAKGEA